MNNDLDNAILYGFLFGLKATIHEKLFTISNSACLIIDEGYFHPDSSNNCDKPKVDKLLGDIKNVILEIERLSAVFWQTNDDMKDK